MVTHNPLHRSGCAGLPHPAPPLGHDVQAYMWYTLAAGQGDDLAGKFKDPLEKFMTLEQLAEAQQLAREWEPRGRMCQTCRFRKG